ncbi:MAG: DHH family phosphoesterase, partial [Muribaculaceae bacterium]|nr:DHH family phosphoesterase [Muribaculaceae bacterium]
CRTLQNLGIKVKVVVPDTPPRYLMFLPGAENVVVFSRSEPFARRLFQNTELVFCLDYNESRRIDHMEEAMLSSPAPKVMIDHHLHPSDFPDVVISHPEVSSTSALVFEVLCALGIDGYVDQNAATCLYTGMMTDTGNFSYNSNDPNLYIIIAELLRRGVNKDAVYRKVNFVKTPSRLRLNGFAMSERFTVYPAHRAALITLTRKELNSFQYQKGDTEGLVNEPLTVPDITWSAYLREEDGYVKVSMRSKDAFPVNIVCKEHFNGGGHLNAAGGEFYGTMEECVETFLSILPLYDSYLPCE